MFWAEELMHVGTAEDGVVVGTTVAGQVMSVVRGEILVPPFVG